MKTEGYEIVDSIQKDQGDLDSLCSLYVGSEVFGIDTTKIREVLGERRPHRVPLSPSFVAGVVPYRGDVLTAVNLRSLLGMESCNESCCVLVMEGIEGAERFGLVVDAVGGVVTVSVRMLKPNPSTLEARAKWLFEGAYKMEEGLMVRLNPQRLFPSRLAETGLFQTSTKGENDASPDCR